MDFHQISMDFKGFPSKWPVLEPSDRFKILLILWVSNTCEWIFHGLQAGKSIDFNRESIGLGSKPIDFERFRPPGFAIGKEMKWVFIRTQWISIPFEWICFPIQDKMGVHQSPMDFNEISMDSLSKSMDLLPKPMGSLLKSIDCLAYNSWNTHSQIMEALRI